MVSEIKLGDVSTTRDFTFVEDTCRGLIGLAETDASIGQTVNIGSNFEISIRDIVQSVSEIMHRPVEIVSDKERIRPEGSEVFRLWCDNSRIKDLTGFSPSVDILSGLSKTIAWFQDPDNLLKYKAQIYNV